MAHNLDDYMSDNWDEKTDQLISEKFDDNPEFGAELLKMLLESDDQQLKNFGRQFVKEYNILDNLETELEKDWNESHEPDPDAEHDKDR